MATNTDEREEIKPVAPTEQTKWRDPGLVGKYMVDPKTGLAGLFRSPDNGETWVLTDTVYGHVYNQDEVDNIWDNGAAHKVADEIKSATADLPNVRKQADEAVKFAESAIAASKVNSDAIVAQSEAISEAKSAMDSATAEIQQTAANAASDAAKIRADVARVQNEVDTAKTANSASVEALKSDINTAKQDLANVHDSLDKAQSAVEQNQKLINDSVAKINSDIAQSRQDIVTAQQANNDLAKQLDTYSKEAQEQGKTIKTIQDNQDGFSITIADVKGDVTKVSDTVDGLSAGLKDAQGNIASVKAQADQLNATLTDHSKDIAQLTATAKELSSTLEDADGRLSKVEQTASEQSTTLSDLQGNLTQVKQQADGLVTTLKDAQGDITQIQQKADGTLAQLKSAQGDIASLQTNITGIKATLVSHEGDIHTLQSDSKTLKDDMQDAQGDISTLKKTSTDVTSELKDHDGRISKTEQTASTLVNEFADQQGHLNRVEQTAQGTQQTVANQQGQINTIKTDADGIHETLTGQGNQIANINVTLNGLSSKYEGVEKSGDELKNRLNNLSVGTRNLLHDTSDQYRTLTGDGHLEKSTASDIYTSVANYHGGDHFTYAATITNPSTKSAMLEVCLLDVNKTPLSASGQAYPVLVHSDSVAPGIWNTRENISFRITSDTWYIRTCLVFDGDNAPAGSQVQVKDERLVEGSMAGTWSPNPDDVADKITTNSTQIDQNKKAITLKADQTTVDNLSGEVSQNKAQLKVQAGQISSKVSNADFKTLNDKVANMKIGGRNLLHNTSDQYKTLTGNAWLYGTTASDMWTSTADYSRGQQFVYSATINNTSSVPIRLALYCYGANKVGQLHKATGITVNGGAVAKCSVMITMDQNTWFLCSDVETLDGQAPQFSIQVKDEKLEEGNVATPWTPNPDDLITSISKNSTAIDQTNQQISLKADQTEVDKIKNTATQNSSRLDVMANEISSKVTSTDVNNIVDKRGYATTSTVQSLITQKAGTINESIVKLDQTVKQGAENNVQLVRKSDFADGKGSWTAQWIASATNPAPPAELGQTGMNVLQTNTRDAYEDGIWYSVKPGEKFDVDFWCAPSPAYASSLGLEFVDKDKKNPSWQGVSTKLNGPWEHITGTITAPANASFAMPWFNMDKPADNTGNSAWLAKPSIRRQNATTVAAIQQITASIDGIQSTVANKADKSQITQLSNMIQSKVSSSDFNDLKDKTLWKSTDSIDLNTAVSQQKIFVKGGSNLPPGDCWWYVQVESGYDSRIVQYAVSDRDNIHYSRQYDGSKWSAWSQGATESEITQLRDDINLRVKSGDLLSQINLTAGNTLIQSNKLYLDASSVVFSGRAFIPSAAIASLSADKVNTGWLNTNNVNLGDGRTRIRADHDYMYIQPTGSAASNTGIRMGYSGLDFLTNVIPNGYSSSVPYYSVGYDGAANGYFKISAFDHINPGGTTATQNRFTMYDAISLNNKEVNIAANNKPRIRVTDNGIEVRPTIFFNNENYSGTWAGFTRLDNKDVVEFNTGNNDGENFHVNSGARFMKYVYFNDYCRAQGWLTYSTLSKKTNIKKLDTSLALDKIRQDDQYLYEYKRNVAKGVYDPQASFIIDDVNDVSHYSVPREFIDQTGKYREPSVELSYLIAAFQEIDKQVQTQKEEIKELKEKLQHE